MKLDLIPLIMQKKKQISIAILATLILGFIYSLISTPLYNSYVTIYPVKNDSNMGSMSDFGSMISQFQGLGFSSNNLGGTTYDIKDLVESDELKTSIINNKWRTKKNTDKINLINYWELNKEKYDGLLNSIKNTLSSVVTNDLQAIRADHAKNILTERIEVIEGESGLYTINVLMEEPQLASDIADFIYVYIENYIKNKSNQKASENADFIADRLEESKKDLEESENKSIKYINTKVSIGGDSISIGRFVFGENAKPEYKVEWARLERDIIINQELYTTILKEYEIAKIEEEKEQEILQKLDSPRPAIKRSSPSLILILIICFNFSFISIVSFYFIYENYFKKNLKKT